MRFITKNGLLTIGRHKGKRWNQAPEGWINWAVENVEGFAAELDSIKQAVASKPKGRTYILKRFHQPKS